MAIKYRVIISIICFVLYVTGFFSPLSAEPLSYTQIPGVIHVHSTYSSGHYTIAALIRMAEEDGLEALVMTDHDWVVMEYGLKPFRRLIKIRKDRPSVLKTGVRQYLDEIRSCNDAQKKVILIPGIQSSPFYYWTGNPVRGNLTAHDYRKELITIGLSSPADYENLPVLHKVSLFKVCGRDLLLCLAAIPVLAWGLWLNRPGKRDKIGLVLIGTAMVFLINFHPFRNSDYDPYHGHQGEAPFQDYIDYVQAHGGMTFWSHPESSYAAGGRTLGPIRMKTGPYPESLLKTSGYTGFPAIYGDNAVAHNAGMHWDEVLLEYCAGCRHKPVWTIAEADFHGTGKGESLARYVTVFLARAKSPPDILEAIAQGKMYAVFQKGKTRPVLDDFRIIDNFSEASAMSGQCLHSNDPEIRGRLSTSDDQVYDAELIILKNGKIITAISRRTPFDFHVKDVSPSPGTSYYRLEARIKRVGKIVSNPIFVVRQADFSVARKNVCGQGPGAGGQGPGARGRGPGAILERR